MGIVKWPRVLNPKQLCLMIKQQKNPLTALEIFDSACVRYPSYRHNNSSYAAIIDVLGSSGRVREMKSVIEQMKQEYCHFSDWVFSKIIRTYAKLGEIDASVSLFRQMPQFICVSSSESFHTVLEILISEGDLMEAFKVLEESSERVGFKVRVKSLNLLIGALCQKKRSDLGLEIFHEISELCYFPERETYRILMKGLCEDGRLEDAKHLLYSMLWRISQKGCDADVIVYRTLIESLCSEKRFAEAEEILGKVLKKGLRKPSSRRSFQISSLQEGKSEIINRVLASGGVRNSGSYSAVIADLYSEGSILQANELFEEMLRRGFKPSDSLYEAKVSALCGIGRLREAEEVVKREMPEEGFAASVRIYNRLMEGLCRGGMSEKAEAYLRVMNSRGDKETYEILVNGFCSEGKAVEASRVMERMMRRGFLPEKEVYDRIIVGLCSARKVFDAVLWLEDMASQGRSPSRSAWCSLVSQIIH